jgi:hypothetical protein
MSHDYAYRTMIHISILIILENKVTMIVVASAAATFEHTDITLFLHELS